MGDIAQRPAAAPRRRRAAFFVSLLLAATLFGACASKPTETIAEPPDQPPVTLPEPEPEPPPEPPPPPPRTGVQAPLSGLRTEPSAFADRPLAATIDNLRPARPQLGL